MTGPTIIVPYRNRQEHLQVFIPAMRAYLPEADIIVVEQADSKPFNRGKLINVGYLETKPDYFVAHDIDMVPLEVDYSPEPIVQLACNDIQKVDYLGGVTLFSKESFEKLGGYHNDYFHRAEDNELAFNARRLSLPIVLCPGIFDQLPHERSKREFIPYLWMKAQQRRKIQNQMGICKYNLVSREQKEGYTLLKVEL